jgi:hypothetical protein
MSFSWAEKVPRTEDEFDLNGERYTVRFRPGDALHVCHNLTDRDHAIDHRQICTLLRESAFVQSANNPLLFNAFGVFNNKVYKTVVYLRTTGLAEPKTCYATRSIDERNRFKAYETSNPRR